MIKFVGYAKDIQNSFDLIKRLVEKNVNLRKEAQKNPSNSQRAIRAIEANTEDINYSLEDIQKSVEKLKNSSFDVSNLYIDVDSNISL